MPVYEVALGFNGKENTQFLKYLCGSFMVHNSILPHVTVGRFLAENEEEIVRSFISLAVRVGPIDLSFTELRMFPGGKVVVRAYESQELRERCTVVDKVLKKRFKPLYAPIISCNQFAWLPHVVVGDRLSSLDCKEYLRFFAPMFQPFTALADRFILARSETFEEIVSLKLRDTGIGERFDLLRPGMTIVEAGAVLGRRLVLERHNEDGVVYDFARLPEGVWLFFRPVEGVLYSIRFDEGFKGTVHGIRVGESMSSIRSKLGEPSRTGAFGLFGTDLKWFYDDLVDGATLRIDGSSDEDRSKVIFIC